MARKVVLTKFPANERKRADGFTNINQLRPIKRKGRVIGYRSRINTKEYSKGQFVKKFHYQALLRKARFSYYQRKPPIKFTRSRRKLAGELVYQPLKEGKGYSRSSTLDTMEKRLREEYGESAEQEARRRLAAFEVAYKEAIEEKRVLPDFSEFTGSP